MVDRVDGRLLGTVTTGRPGEQITPIGRTGELDFRLLGVHPGARRRGVGRLLTDRVRVFDDGHVSLAYGIDLDPDRSAAP
ncbi:hypothetical protein [Microbacterium sp.]|uniref:hypothetical protein n=1 Tax=Microbacterium sp. TaxID=51671 RepID=UPI003C7473B2